MSTSRMRKFAILCGLWWRHAATKCTSIHTVNCIKLKYRNYHIICITNVRRKCLWKNSRTNAIKKVLDCVKYPQE